MSIDWHRSRGFFSFIPSASQIGLLKSPVTIYNLVSMDVPGVSPMIMKI